MIKFDPSNAKYDVNLLLVPKCYITILFVLMEEACSLTMLNLMSINDLHIKILINL